MRFAIGLFISALLLAGALALASFLWWLLLLLLVLAGAQKAWEWYEIRKYERTLGGGRKIRKMPLGIPRCQSCSDVFVPCDSCIQRWNAANPA